MAAWFLILKQRRRRRDRGGRQRGDGAGGDQLPVADRPRLPQALREEDLHPAPQPRRQEGTHQPQVGQDIIYQSHYVAHLNFKLHSTLVKHN